mmetsp:Transcript_65172/g.184860  ORF Transcript_65172/g.184860 Transcript_65172/m.184860 type:complete len:219 (+) Transcript_65172:489-1145(+)
MRETLSARSATRCSSTASSAAVGAPALSAGPALRLALASATAAWSSMRWLSSVSKRPQTPARLSLASWCASRWSPTSASSLCMRWVSRFWVSSTPAIMTRSAEGAFWMLCSSSAHRCRKSSSSWCRHSQSRLSMMSTLRICACISSERPLKLPVSSASRRSSLGCRPSAALTFSSSLWKATSRSRSPWCCSRRPPICAATFSSKFSICRLTALSSADS